MADMWLTCIFVGQLAILSNYYDFYVQDLLEEFYVLHFSMKLLTQRGVLCTIVKRYYWLTSPNCTLACNREEIKMRQVQHFGFIRLFIKVILENKSKGMQARGRQ